VRPMQGFEAYVGSKTTIRIQNVDHLGFKEKQDMALVFSARTDKVSVCPQPLPAASKAMHFDSPEPHWRLLYRTFASSSRTARSTRGALSICSTQSSGAMCGIGSVPPLQRAHTLHGLSDSHHDRRRIFLPAGPTPASCDSNYRLR
jgi:hypothetical protein